MIPGQAYSRKVSSEEARERYLMVLKDRLGFFPPLGKTFNLLREGSTVTGKVESYACTCRGPELPHEHYFIRMAGLKKGQRVSIARDEDSGQYRLGAA